jgi:hypothetical protein
MSMPLARRPNSLCLDEAKGIHSSPTGNGEPHEDVINAIPKKGGHNDAFAPLVKQ